MAAASVPTPVGGPLSRNILSVIAAQGITLALLLVVGRGLFRSLGGDAFGLITFSSTVSTGLAGVLDLGTTSTVVRELAASRSDADYVTRVVRTGSMVCWITYVLSALGVLWISPLLVESWLHVGALDPSRATHALTMLAASGLLGIPRSLYAAALRGVERLGLSSGMDAAAVTVQQGGALALASNGIGLEGIAGWLALSQVMWTAAYAVTVHRLFGGAALGLGLDGAAIRRNLPFARSMLSISALAALHSNADRLILSGLLPVARFGYYAFGYAAVSRGALLASAVAQAALPAFSSQVARGEKAELARRYHRLQGFMCHAAAVLFAAVPFAVLPILGVVFAPAVARDLLAPLTLVAFGFFLSATITVPYVLSLAAGEPDITVRFNLHAAWLNLPATAVLVLRLGLVGAGLSWVSYHVIAYAYALPHMCRRCLGLPWAVCVRPSATALGLALAAYAPAWAAANVAGGGPLAMAAAFAGGTAVFLAGAARLSALDLRDVLEQVGLAPRRART